MRLTVCFVLLLLLSGAPAGAQPTTTDAAAVTAVVHEFHSQLRAGDAAGVMRLIADDALMLEAGGFETRDEYEKHHLPADIEFEKTVTSKRSDIRVVLNGQTAWATSSAEFTGTFRGRSVDTISAELMVLTREPAGWRIRAIHWSGRARKPAK